MADPIPPQLPHLIIEEPKRSKFALMGIVIVSLTLFAIPIGVYLTLQNQNPTSKAVSDEIKQPEIGYTLETEKKQVGVGSIFPVKVTIKSDSQSVNIFSFEALFPQNLLEIVKMDVLPVEDPGYTSIPNARVIHQKFNNLNGSISLIVGIPDAGLKTNFSDKKTGIATIYFRSKDIGDAKVTLEEQTAIFSAESKQNILQKEVSPLDITISPDIPTENALGEESSAITSKSSLIQLLTPNGGETFHFTDEIPIRWNLDEKTLPSVTVSLYMNGKLFGVIAKQIPNKKELIFKPETALQPIFANDSSSFQFLVEGKSNTGDNLSVMSEGPFGIYSTDDFNFVISPSAEIKTGAKDLNGDNDLNLSDLSEILALYGKTDDKSLKADLSNDKAVNDIDVWILKKGLVNNGVIKEN